MYELLSGRPPFSGDNWMAVMAGHLTKSPDAADRRSTTPVSPQLDAVVRTALRRYPEHRYQTRGGPAARPRSPRRSRRRRRSTCPPSRPSAAWRRPRSSKRLWLLIAGVAGAVHRRGGPHPRPHGGAAMTDHRVRPRHASVDPAGLRRRPRHQLCVDHPRRPARRGDRPPACSSTARRSRDRPGTSRSTCGCWPTRRPWCRSADGEARVTCTVLRPDGTPWMGDPRNALRIAIDEAGELADDITVSAELEFYVLDPDGGTVDQAGYFDDARHRGWQVVRESRPPSSSSQGITVASCHHEDGPGQYEIDLAPIDPMATADALVVGQGDHPTGRRRRRARRRRSWPGPSPARPAPACISISAPSRLLRRRRRAHPRRAVVHRRPARPRLGPDRAGVAHRQLVPAAARRARGAQHRHLEHTPTAAP